MKDINWLHAVIFLVLGLVGGYFLYPIISDKISSLMGK